MVPMLFWGAKEPNGMECFAKFLSNLHGVRIEFADVDQLPQDQKQTLVHEQHFFNY
jgi:hypothetical protein